MRSVIKSVRREVSLRSAAQCVRDLYEAWNERRWADVARALDPNVEWFHAGRHELVRGADCVAMMLSSQAECFPNARIELRSVREAEGTVFAEWTVVHADACSALKPAIVCEVLDVRGGRIARATTYGDVVTMLMEFREEWRPPLRAVC